MLCTGEKGEPREENKGKGGTNKATGSAKCFRNSTADILSGVKKPSVRFRKLFY